MKITKLIHSCLLVEKDHKKILVDPGVYSWQNEKVRNTNLSDIQAVVITHSHPDHLHEEFVKAIAQASPTAEWYGTQEVVDTLKGLGIPGLVASKDRDIRFIASEHADLSPWFDTQPQHTSYVIFDELLISGDCQTLTSTHGARILAAAINGGPWGAVVGFSKMIEAMTDRPKVVIPLHDWHWNEDARDAIYIKIPEVMTKFGVRFVALDTGMAQEI